MGMTQRQNDTYLFIRDIDAMRYKVQEEKKLRKISSQKFDPTGEFFHDSAIQMQAFIAFAAQKFGIKEILSIFAT